MPDLVLIGIVKYIKQEYMLNLTQKIIMVVVFVFAFAMFIINRPININDERSGAIHLMFWDENCNKRFQNILYGPSFTHVHLRHELERFGKYKEKCEQNAH